MARIAFKGLAIIERAGPIEGVVRYVLQADPDLAVKEVRNAQAWNEPHSSLLEFQGLLARNILAIRQDFPYLYLLTNDRPDDVEVESHMDAMQGLYDKAFMERFPPAMVHIDYGRYPPDTFSYGPRVISRLFDVGRDDIGYLWPALINDCYNRLSYVMLYAAKHIPAEPLVGAMEEARTGEEFESKVLDLVDVLAFVQEEPNLFVLTKNQSVRTEVERTAYHDWKASE